LILSSYFYIKKELIPISDVLSEKQRKMTTIIVQTEGEKMEALRAFLNALKISFEIKNDEYDADFVKKIQESEEDFKEGRSRKLNLDDIWK
jgi:hypothetical protein